LGFFHPFSPASHIALKRVADGKWNVVGQKLQNPKGLEYWAAINFYPERVAFDSASRAMQSLANCTHTLGQFHSTASSMDTLV